MIFFLFIALVWSAEIGKPIIVNKNGLLQITLESNEPIPQKHLEFSTTERKVTIYIPAQELEDDLLLDYNEHGINYVDLRNEEDALRIVISTETERKLIFKNHKKNF